MGVRRRFFTNEISDLIYTLLDTNNDLSFLKTIAKGDLSLMPAPEKYKDFMPAVYIDPSDIYNDISVNKSIAATRYEFDIRYVKYYVTDMTYDIKEQAINEAQFIGDTLMEDMDLHCQDLSEGKILKTSLPHIAINSEENDIFTNLKVPVIVIDIQYLVYFRSNIKY